MQQGFIKVACVTPTIKVADPHYNKDELLKGIQKAAGQGAKIIVTPELGLTGYTCHDLFYQELLLQEAKQELLRLLQETTGLDALIFVGLPLEYMGKLYNVAAVLCRGQVLGLVPKTHLPNYGEFYELRHFTKGGEQPVAVK